MDDLSGQSLEGERFLDDDLTEAEIRGAQFTDCAFRGVRFSAAVLSECAFVNCTFALCGFFDTRFVRCKLVGSQFHGCTFGPFTVEGGNWSFSELRAADLRKCSFEGVRLREADLSLAQLQQASCATSTCQAPSSTART